MFGKNFSFKNCEGAKYEVIFNKPNAKHFGEDTEGVCHPPNETTSKVYISPYLTKQSELNTVIHEMAHTINHVVFEEINEIFFYERIYDIAVQAIDNGIFPVFEGHPVSFSVGEFWASTIEGYIMNRPGFKDSHDTRDWIAENDPQLYELITRYFPTDEWTYCPGLEEQKY